MTFGNWEVPPDHLRCEQTARGTGKRCKRMRHTADGARFCVFHGGRRRCGKYRTKMRNRYSAFGGPQLNKLLEATAGENESPDKILDVTDEVHLARTTALTAVALYEASLSDEAGAQAKLLAIHAVKSAVEFVTATAEKSAKILSALPSIYDAQIADHFVRNIQAILEEELDEETFGRIVRRMKTIQLPHRDNSRAPLDAQAIADELSRMKEIA
jgi:hypothetical protein